ncbi:hypothetical protein BJY04DRAFT_143136 [Aspergillus karnatakaensis]|uniref:uncharacterized protein n=1 Tax=Aspergillus karnatakaensis TaxID=1810916 RepID=UPI003CCCC122
MLVETLRKSRKGSTLFFFCSRTLNGPDREDPTIILRALVHQLVAGPQHSQFPDIVTQAFNKRHFSTMQDDGIDFSECLKILAVLLDTSCSTSIIIDALDECGVEDRIALLEAVQQLIDSSKSTVQIFISSRPARDIAVHLSQWPALVIDEALTRQDMERFVQREVRESIRKKSLLYGDVSQELEE